MVIDYPALDHICRRLPVADLLTLSLLDDAEIEEGYHDGRENFPCGENRSRSYWHGWRNGMMDGRHMDGDWASRELAHLYLDKLRTATSKGVGI